MTTKSEASHSDPFPTLMTHRATLAKPTTNHRFTAHNLLLVTIQTRLKYIETYNAILPVIPLEDDAKPLNIGSEGSWILSPPYAHVAWTTCRQRKRRVKD